MADTTVIHALFTKQVLRDFELHLGARTRRVYEHDGHPFNSARGLVLTFVEASPPDGREPSHFDLTVKYDTHTETYSGTTEYVPLAGAPKVVPFEDLDADVVVQPRVVLGWVGRLREAYEHDTTRVLAEVTTLVR
jgi:hypothetical protein